MDIKIPETNKKQFNELAEKILKSLADTFPVGIHPTAKTLNTNNQVLEGVLAYLIHADYLFSPKENMYYLSEKSVLKINRSGALVPMDPIIK
ncbi:MULTISPECIES: hypothetical protein [unclassified Pseudoalteromonas]|uniref:hypothetical protein n=1 Tax=unclassified Pseudoalteromonas TaxID=194690 RepID=UPI0015FFEC26|nr:MULTISPECIES: hypothetical protein [unclassified Pseudoalteromonas]MBB1333890.1 hypothetical protein [Pseudoalteromonas sp. SR41-6]MBB1459611.1 hypothetical protein [Pseudoalteromonas sp. SG41-8]